MKPYRLIYFLLVLLSASILCFEIIATRITSVIFVNDYAFMILSLAILGLGSGGIISYYRMKSAGEPSKIIFILLVLLSISFCMFIVSVIEFSLTDPVPYFFLLVLPFFLGGMVYACVYRQFPERSFTLYACDLSGAALGSVGSLGVLSFLGAPNGVLFVALVAFGGAVTVLHRQMKTRYIGIIFSILVLCVGLLTFNGRKELLGEVPIGYFPEKDFYHVYPDPAVRYRILESRWSMYGRSDLVQYSHQDMVRQMFIDGAAGTQVYRFNGNIQHTNSILQELLLHQTTAIPFLCLHPDEKRSMLAIGPGGGKEILLGLFGGVGKITGVEVNPDFVDIVKEYQEFDGGVYSKFTNVHLIVEEGRHYVKQLKEPVDVLIMALPSTEQMQNIEPFAMSENYLLTREALKDYFTILTPEGRMIVTVHNRWELLRLLTTTVSVLREVGVAGSEVQKHVAVFDAEYAPTVVLKKNIFSNEEALRWKTTCESLPKDFPQVTFLPYGMKGDDRSAVVNFLTVGCSSDESLQAYIAHHEYDLAPCRDDQPYFYKIQKGVPLEFLRLLAAVAGFNLLLVLLSLRMIHKTKMPDAIHTFCVSLALFSCIGMGCMVLEISLFQKLVLYLGSPTVSLSILLSSLLVGMGLGSFFGDRIAGGDTIRRLVIAGGCIVLTGILLFVVSPAILSKCLELGTVLSSIICFLIILPLAFFMGIPFPSGIQLLRLENKEKYIPWMYGINGTMSVFGSVLAIVLSMYWGFTATYFIGLSVYLCFIILLYGFTRRGLLIQVKQTGSAGK